MESFGLLLLCVLAAVVNTAPPYVFISEKREINVLEGENADIVCSITGLRQPLPVLWLNQSFVFGMNDMLYEDNERVKLIGDVVGDTRTYTLSVSDIVLTDEGEYECQVPGSFKLRQRHNLIVNIPPEITSDRNEQEFDLKLSENIELGCPATGKPAPVVTWRRIDGSPIQDTESVEGELLSLNNVTENENGQYICIASNGFGTDPTRMFTVNVLFEPRVETPSKLIHTGPGHSVRLECTFSGNPSVQTIWQHLGQDINVNRYKVGMSTLEASGKMNTWVSTLDIEDIQLEQLGEYTCLGSNTLGSASESVTLSANPHSLVIKSASQGSYSDQYSLEWEFSSKPDPIECLVTVSQLNLTEEGLYKFVPLGNTTVPAKQAKGEVHPQSYVITGLQENMTYTARLQCRNEHGSINTSDEFEFQTSQDVNLAPIPPTPEEEEDLETILSTLPRNRAPTTEEVQTTAKDEEDVDDDEEDDIDDDDNKMGEVKLEVPVAGESRDNGGTRTTPVVALLLATSIMKLVC